MKEAHLPTIPEKSEKIKNDIIKRLNEQANLLREGRESVNNVSESKAHEIPEESHSNREFVPPPVKSHRNYHYVNEEIVIERILSLTTDDILDHLNKSEEEITVPSTRSKMLKDPYAWEYIKAEIVELNGIQKHGTFESVVCPPDAVPITCRWVYDIKRNVDGTVQKFKARLVVHGYKQVEGRDFNRTFSSTTQIRSFRMIVALSTELGLTITQYDISNAFLNGVLEEPVYMHFPPGYQSEQKGLVIKLVKALYGLRQSSRVWQTTLYACLAKAGLKPCKTDSGVLYCKTENGDICLVFSWVDDLGIACKCEKTRKKIVKLLNDEFILKSLGELSHYVGIVIEKTDNGYQLHQGPYNARIVKKYLGDDIKASKVPANPNERLSVIDCPVKESDKPDYPYINVTGSLLYTAICTRPDLFYSVMQLARFNTNPGNSHVKASIQVIRYLKNDPNLGIKFSKSKDFDGKIRIRAFVDSDWGGCVDTRRSTLGYVIHVANGPVSWKSKTPKTIALSSCEAEFMALSEVCRELMWMCRFLDEIGIEYHTPEIHCDSSSAIRWAEDPVQHQRNKHVELKYYYCRDLVADEKVRIFKIHTTKQCADIMTKPVGKQILEKLGPPTMGYELVTLDTCDRKGVR